MDWALKIVSLCNDLFQYLCPGDPAHLHGYLGYIDF